MLLAFFGSTMIVKKTIKILLNAHEVRGLCLVTFLALEWIVKGAIYAFPSSTSKFAIVMLIKQLDPGMQLD